MIYIAGPFFNERQLNRVKQLEEICHRCMLTCYSPRRDGGILNSVSTLEARTRIFEQNERALEECSIVIAIDNYELPEGIQLLPCYLGSPIKTRDGAVRLPDIGTVWEMGYAYALKKRVILFHDDLLSQSTNVMLERSCIGVAYSFEQLEDFLNAFAERIDPIPLPSDVIDALSDMQLLAKLSSWKGKVQ